jgi:hypothetical protein
MGLRGEGTAYRFMAIWVLKGLKLALSSRWEKSARILEFPPRWCGLKRKHHMTPEFRFADGG